MQLFGFLRLDDVGPGTLVCLLVLLLLGDSSWTRIRERPMGVGVSGAIRAHWDSIFLLALSPPVVSLAHVAEHPAVFLS